ncbi:MAG: hypothetical protein AAFQ87_19970, partial [Bacteroidota bacterium]
SDLMGWHGRAIGQLKTYFVKRTELLFDGGKFHITCGNLLAQSSVKLAQSPSNFSIASCQ